MKNDEVQKKERLLRKIAAINGRMVIFSEVRKGIYQTVDCDATDAFKGTLDAVIEWGKGYIDYINWSKKHDKGQNNGD